MTKDGSIGWIGPSEDPAAIRAAADLLLGLGLDQVVYLGDDDVLRELTDKWVRELGGDGRPFLVRVAEIAQHGSPEDIAGLLQTDRAIRSLGRLRTLPPPPTRAIEMLNGRIILAVHDKKVLDEEDIANATVVVFGRSDAWLFKRFGPRYFMTPGPLSGGRVAVLEDDGEGHLELIAYDVSDGKELERHLLQGATTRMTVSG